MQELILGKKNSNILEESLLASSKSVNHKGLAQYFTSEKVSQLINSLLNLSYGSTIFDPCAGSGRLLKPFSNYHNDNILGIEIDKSVISNGSNIYYGDIQKVFPILEKIGFKCNLYVANPPFGLQWQFPYLSSAGFEGKVESQTAIVELGFRILKEYGLIALILPTSIFENEKDVRILELINNKIMARFDMINAFKSEYSTNVKTSLIIVDPYRNNQNYIHELIDIENISEENLKVFVDRFVDQYKERINRFKYDGSSNTIPANINEIIDGFSKSEVVSFDNKQRGIVYLSGNKLKFYFTESGKKLFDSSIHNMSWEEKNIIEKVNNSPLSYYVFNNREWNILNEVAKNYSIVFKIDPLIYIQYQKLKEKYQFLMTPFYTLPDRMRLAYLEDCDSIICKKNLTVNTDNDKKHFIANKQYPVRVYFRKGLNESEVEDKKHKVKEWGFLVVNIDENIFRDDNPDDIRMLSECFVIPNPNCVANIKPEYHQQLLNKLDNNNELQKLELMDYQKEDISRLAMKSFAFLAWDMGLGKTRCAIAWSLLRGYKKNLIICHSRIINTWRDEINKIGQSVVIIKDYQDIWRLKQDIKNKTYSKFYIISYEGLSSKKEIWSDYICKKCGKIITTEKCSCGRKREKESNCLKCGEYISKYSNNWNGKYCSSCGYSAVITIPPIYTKIKKLFSSIIVDEIHACKTKNSLRGIAVRSLHSKGKLTLTGTPIKGYITDIYWVLYWVFNGGSPLFPYNYTGGCSRFLDEFAVTEYCTDQFRNSLSSGRKKILPEIANVSRFWRLISPKMIRRLKDDTEELELPEKSFHKIEIPMFEHQLQVYNWWLNNFVKWFAKNRDSLLSENAVALKQQILGQLWKLRAAATIPSSTKLKTNDRESSCEDNYDNTKLKAIQKIVDKKYNKKDYCLIYSGIREMAHAIRDRLSKKYKVGLILGETTIPKRDQILKDFSKGKLDVLVMGIKAGNLAYTITRASAVIFSDLEWSSSDIDQATDRCHRISQIKEVKVYYLLSKNTIDDRIYDLINMKRRSSGLALDGKLVKQNSQEISWMKIAEEIAMSSKIETKALSETNILRQNKVNISLKAVKKQLLLFN